MQVPMETGPVGSLGSGATCCELPNVSARNQTLLLRKRHLSGPALSLLSRFWTLSDSQRGAGSPSTWSSVACFILALFHFAKTLYFASLLLSQFGADSAFCPLGPSFYEILSPTSGVTLTPKCLLPDTLRPSHICSVLSCPGHGRCRATLRISAAVHQVFGDSWWMAEMPVQLGQMLSIMVSSLKAPSILCFSHPPCERHSTQFWGTVSN